MIPWILQPSSQVDVHGRGTGKSAGLGQTLNRNIRKMPGGITSITGQSFGQLLTRTLPSTFKFLEQQFGYVRGVHYVINQTPPKFFKSTYERISRFDNFISTITGHGGLLISQDRSGSGRGPSVDFEVMDEGLTINKEKYDQEVSPTNRGNDEKFGKYAKNPLKYHHGFHYSSSMPQTSKGKWLLKYGEYYEKEAGINIFKEWNNIVQMQLDLLEMDKASDFQLQWNEIQRAKRKIRPFVSNKGILFTLANVFDNERIDFLGYIRKQKEKLTTTEFLVEIMNKIIDRVEDCFYNIDDNLHVYHNADNDDFIRGVADNTEFDFNILQKRDCRFDQDCALDQQMEISFDWGAHISVMTIGQERNYDFATSLLQPTDNFINEFFSKPEAGKVMIDELIDQFTEYYRFHKTKELLYYKDRHGDIKHPNASKTYNEQAIDRLRAAGWVVFLKEHRGQEPPVHDKYLLFANSLKEYDPRYPKIRFNGTNCKYTLISLKQTKVIEEKGKFKKDKSTEDPKKGVPQEESTHFSDAVDKRIWTKYNKTLRKGSSFIPARH